MTDTDDEEMTLPRALELVIEASRHCPICEVEDFDGQAIDICSDNYRIMAAAPDLIEALEQLIAFIPDKNQSQDVSVWISHGKAAIAKSRGEQ